MASTAASANTFTDIKVNEPLCFQQEYSAEHLIKHSRQTVKSMKIKVYRGTEEGDSENLYMAVQAELKVKNSKEPKSYKTGMLCSPDEKRNGLNCSVECDGGQARLRASTTSGDQVRFINDGFVLFGGCDGDGDEETIRLKPTKGGDDQFLLNKMTDAKACEAIKGW